MDGVDDFSRVDSLEVDRDDPEVRVPELRLDDGQRNPFVRHLDRVSMPQLVGCEPRRTPACAARRRSSPGAAVADQPRPRVGPARMQNSGPIGSRTRCSVQQATCSQPQSSIPTILRFPPLPARTSTDPGLRVEIGLGERQRLADPQPCAPQHRDQPARSIRGPGPASRITRMISSTVGGSAGKRSPLFGGAHPAQ